MTPPTSFITFDTIFIVSSFTFWFVVHEHDKGRPLLRAFLHTPLVPAAEKSRPLPPRKDGGGVERKFNVWKGLKGVGRGCWRWR